MNAMTVFRDERFGEVRTVTLNGEPWFVGKDVASVLGYRDTSDALKKHVDTEDKEHPEFDMTPYTKVTDYRIFEVKEI